MLLLLRKRHTLHEHWPGEIYTIGEIVSHVVLMPINSEGHFGSVTSYGINEKYRLIQHVDIIVGFGDPKKVCQIQRSREATTSMMITEWLMSPV
jgi:hypothetical protein